MGATTTTQARAVSSFATQYRRYDRMLARFGRRMLDRSGVGPAQRVIDVGCGAGTLTLDVARRVGGRGRAIGIDVSPDVIEVARERARHRRLSNIRFLLGDATEYDFPLGRADIVISRFGSCRFQDSVEGYQNVRRALRPGGTLAFVCPREAQRNPWATVPYRAIKSVIPELEDEGGAGPFGLADDVRIRRILREAGYRDIQLESLDDPVCLGEDVDDALEFFFETDGRALSAALEDEQLQGVTRALRDAIAPYEDDWGVWMPASAWLVRACNG